MALPFEGKQIMQDRDAQGVSVASAALVDYALQSFEDAPLCVLDLGCGCGIVSIMCALSRPQWQVQGIDIQKELIELAIANAASCELDISFCHQDLREHSGKYDLILANPPLAKSRHWPSFSPFIQESQSRGAQLHDARSMPGHRALSKARRHSHRDLSRSPDQRV
ncbi:MAG: methyltransferase [Candidatus Cloacimonetes bacterium]|nr:methyltransferase [Candidatus Cloacimonadota bacterium]